jgi:hypothetical protein
VAAVIAVGPAVQMAGWALAGVDVRPAETPAQATDVWDCLPPGTGLLIVAAEVAEAVQGRAAPPGALTLVLEP